MLFGGEFVLSDRRYDGVQGSQWPCSYIFHCFSVDFHVFSAFEGSVLLPEGFKQTGLDFFES